MGEAPDRSLNDIQRIKLWVAGNACGDYLYEKGIILFLPTVLEGGKYE